MIAERKKTLWLVLSGFVLLVMAATIVTLGSLRLPVEPRRASDTVILFALSTLIVAAFLVFGLILTRNLLKLWAERRAEKLGSRFRTKMVLGAVGIALLPMVFLFVISYALLNLTLNRWFPRPLEVVAEESQVILRELEVKEHGRLLRIAESARQAAMRHSGAEESAAEVGVVQAALDSGADAAWTTGPDGGAKAAGRNVPGQTWGLEARFERKLGSGAEVWRVGNGHYLAARVPLGDGSLLAGKEMPVSFAQRLNQIEEQLALHEKQKEYRRTFERQMLMILGLFTLLLMFSATWFAMFLSKQVTVPIQALAEATREVSAGNFEHRVDAQARDELGILVSSFNEMTAQLGESRQQIFAFNKSLQDAVQEMERQKQLIEAILENVPTGVVSVDGEGRIASVNGAVVRMFGAGAAEARTLRAVLGDEAAREVEQLMRRALRMGLATREMEITLPGRVVHAAVTVSALGPRRTSPGFIVVVDDLSELLRAQKAAAWQEVAQRIAHEIKNPLTPIQLSAQRLARHVERGEASEPEMSKLVGECAGLIEREVASLKTLVDEFSQFARFPSAKLAAVDANTIVREALEPFHGRIEGIRVRTELAAELPVIRADAELLRRVVVNLIDNAAEAMEGSKLKELAVGTRVDQDGETVEIFVADSGPGISPQDKDRLFLPHFSTKGRGTGLGLAIASRILAEHNGTIRAEDNQPVGARFVLRIPVVEVGAERVDSR